MRLLAGLHSWTVVSLAQLAGLVYAVLQSGGGAGLAGIPGLEGRVMAKAKEGSDIVPVRIPANLLTMIDEAIAKSVRDSDIPYGSRSGFILYAIWEVFRHRARARASCRRKQERRANQRLADAARAGFDQSEEERE